MFTMKDKSSISEGQVKRAIGLRKDSLQERRNNEVNMNTLFETAFKNQVKEIWLGVMENSNILENAHTHSKSLDMFFETHFENYVTTNSVELRESSIGLPDFTRSMVNVIETMSFLEAAKDSSEMTSAEKDAIDDIMKVNGKGDVVKDIAKTVNKAIDLSVEVGEKIIKYDEEELESRTNDIEDTQNQLEAAGNVLAAQNRIGRNIIENLTVASYKNLLREGYSETDSNFNEQVKLQALSTYALLETCNQLGLMDNDPESVKMISENLRR